MGNGDVRTVVVILVPPLMSLCADRCLSPRVWVTLLRRQVPLSRVWITQLRVNVGNASYGPMGEESEG